MPTWSNAEWHEPAGGALPCEEPHELTVRLSDGTTRSMFFCAPEGARVLSAEVDGRRLVPARAVDFDDVELD